MSGRQKKRRSYERERVCVCVCVKMSMTADPGSGGGMGGAGILDGSAQQRMMEESFREFCARPENRELMEAHQKKEMKKQEKQRARMEAERFQDVVLSSEYDAQKSIAPFLKYPVLRKIIQTFTNDPSGDFGRWATNERVLSMLRAAKEVIDEGRMSEYELETVMMRYITAGFGDASSGGAGNEEDIAKAKAQNRINMSEEEFKLRTRQQVRLTTDQLVGPLNEHLKERSKGNDRYRAGQLDAAAEHYTKALSIVEYIVGVSSADQHEIDINKVTALLNLAAVSIEKKEFGAAVTFCTKAIKVSPKNLKAFVRRCKAHIGRRNYDDAKKDIESIRLLDPYGNDAAELEQKLKRQMRSDNTKDKDFYKNVVRTSA